MSIMSHLTRWFGDGSRPVEKRAAEASSERLSAAVREMQQGTEELVRRAHLEQVQADRITRIATQAVRSLRTAGGPS